MSLFNKNVYLVPLIVLCATVSCIYGMEKPKSRVPEEKQKQAQAKLMRAIRPGGNISDIAEALREGAEVYPQGRTSAVFEAISYNRVDVINEFARLYIDFNQEDPLHEAAVDLFGDHPNRPELIRALVRGGAKINEKKYGRTALHVAAAEGRRDIVKVLLELGADATIKNDDGETADQEALESHHADIAKMIIEHRERTRGGGIFGAVGKGWIGGLGSKS